MTAADIEEALETLLGKYKRLADLASARQGISSKSYWCWMGAGVAIEEAIIAVRGLEGI